MWRTEYSADAEALWWTDPEAVEPQARQQIENLARMPFVDPHVAVMPDIHFGLGAPVGTVIPTDGAIIPAAVGVDIGCGMIAVLTTLRRADFPEAGSEALADIRRGIERRIPSVGGPGDGKRGGPKTIGNSKIQPTAEPRIAELEALARERNVDLGGSHGWQLQLGSLGAGNHFVELSTDEHDRVWAFLHSGSRGVGNRLATWHIKVAQEFCRKAFIPLVDKDLAYFPERAAPNEFWEYMRALGWAQRFAELNREEMMDRLMEEVARSNLTGERDRAKLEVERVACHHNFTQKERHFGRDLWVTRKGAISADIDQPGLIPGSMGTASYVVEGRGCIPALKSSPHGAGRNFSRNEARKRFSMEDFDRQTEGVEVRRSEKLLDEIPAAYKDIEAVMGYADPLVRVRHTLKAFCNVKGD